MFIANGSFGRLQGSYLFAEIDRRTKAYKAAHPEAEIIRMGIGDVTRPLAKPVLSAMHKAVDEMGTFEGFRGYPSYEGYDFLREAIAKRDYTSRGLAIAAVEIFVSDGAKCDVANLAELFAPKTRIAVVDPVYPVYVNSNVIIGHGGAYDADKNGYSEICYLPATAENGFVPALPSEPVDVIYLCYPNNPTGTVLKRDELQKFVDWANENGALIIFDSAYEAFISSPDTPRSIFELAGARACAIECRSFSKTAGFTGMRCGYLVIPKELSMRDESGSRVTLHALWSARISHKSNGVSYITQVGAAAALTDEGYAACMEDIAFYKENARIIKGSLTAAGYTVFGGVDAPYVWLKVPDSWAFFDKLLNEYQIVGTPGAGFGAAGEGYLRMTAFATRENTLMAMERLSK